MMYFNIFFYTEPVSAFLDHFSQNLEIQRSTLLALKRFHSRSSLCFLLVINTVYTSSSSSSNAHLRQTTVQSIQQHTRFAPFLHHHFTHCSFKKNKFNLTLTERSLFLQKKSLTWLEM